MVLNLFYERLSISLIYDGTIPLQYLKIVVALKILLFQKLGINIFSQMSRTYVRARG